MNISKYFYNQESEELKDNIYYDIIMDTLRKKRNKLFTIYGILNTYSLFSKKKIDDIMNDKSDISVAIDFIKNDNNVLYYYYCKNDKLYYILEYTITPDIRTQRNNIDININESIDGQFAKLINIDTIKNILIEPKKYLNFNPKNVTINKENLIKYLIKLNEEETLKNIIEKYDICITEKENGCGVKYEELLNDALKSKNVNVVNMINKCFYEKKYKNLNKTENQKEELDKQKENIELIKITGAIINLLTFPILLYMSFFKFNSC